MLPNSVSLLASMFIVIGLVGGLLGLVIGASMSALLVQMSRHLMTDVILGFVCFPIVFLTLAWNWPMQIVTTREGDAIFTVSRASASPMILALLVTVSLVGAHELYRLKRS